MSADHDPARCAEANYACHPDAPAGTPHWRATPCNAALVPRDAAMTLMRHTGLSAKTRALIASDPDKAKAIMAEIREASEQVQACIEDEGHRPPHRDKDGNTWTDPDPDDEAPWEYDPTMVARPAADVLCSEGTPIDREADEHSVLRTCGAPVRYGGKHDAEHAAHAPAPADEDMKGIVGWMADNPDAIPEEFREPAKAAAETASERARRVVDEAEARLCECNRPDERDNPHRHEYDAYCALWKAAMRDVADAREAWADGRMSRDRIDAAKRALRATGVWEDDEVSDDVAPRISELWSFHCDAVEALVEAIRLTAEYAQLPAVLGWSWYDALVRFAPDTAARMRREWDERQASERAAAALADPPPPVVHTETRTAPGPFDLQDGVTQVAVRPARIGYTVDVTYRGVSLATYKWAWTADRAEAKGQAMIEREARRDRVRREQSRVIDLTDTYKGD